MEMQTTKRERISYYSYFFGQNLFYMIIASYISLFLLNHGVNEALAASVGTFVSACAESQELHQVDSARCDTDWKKDNEGCIYM